MTTFCSIGYHSHFDVRILWQAKLLHSSVLFHALPLIRVTTRFGLRRKIPLLVQRCQKVRTVAGTMLHRHQQNLLRIVQHNNELFDHGWDRHCLVRAHIRPFKFFHLRKEGAARILSFTAEHAETENLSIENLNAPPITANKLNALLKRIGIGVVKFHLVLPVQVNGNVHVAIGFRDAILLAKHSVHNPSDLNNPGPKHPVVRYRPVHLAPLRCACSAHGHSAQCLSRCVQTLTQDDKKGQNLF